LVYCGSGEVEMTIDECAFTLAAGEVVPIASGQIHSLINISQARGFILLLEARL